MFPYDAQLLAAAQATPQSIDDVIRTMEAIDALCADGDGLKWFNRLYLEVTQAVGARVAQGGFHDPAWMAALDVNFAALYFQALATNLSGRHGAALLARALRPPQLDSAGARAVRPGRRQCAHQSRSADRHRAHRTGARAWRRALRRLYGDQRHAQYPGRSRQGGTACAIARRVLPPVSHLEDTLAAFSMSAAREAAWNNAEMLWALRPFPRLSARMETTLDGMSAVIGKTLLVPVVEAAQVAQVALR